MRALLGLTLAVGLQAQVYTPTVRLEGQPDSSSLSRLADGIFAKYSAHSERERAEAIWRFFLTDGRFVEPGFWYHIAGWAYEEPAGEVLDPLKLLNSYGFGLCYQIAPLLESVWKAGGFRDARVWFLTGHTVAEVYYDGGYHYFDSDMMGYNRLATGSAASVEQIEKDGSIIIGKLRGKREVDERSASRPWYPADVRADAIGDLAELFTTTKDNWLFPSERAPQGHSMDFVLRPGERLIRYFAPEHEGLYYLPYKRTGDSWSEFPREIAQYQIRTGDGPRSQKDNRSWATGRLEYEPPITSDRVQVIPVRSPYVIIDAGFSLELELTSAEESVQLETSADGGLTYVVAGRRPGPYRGAWRADSGTLTRSEHGKRTAVSGSYGYLLRVTRTGGSSIRSLRLSTVVQLNPRTLPALTAGRNRILYTSGPERLRVDLPLEPSKACAQAAKCESVVFESDGSQGYWRASDREDGELIFHVSGHELESLRAGGRFLDLSAGLAPDKYTAEVRKIRPVPARSAAASIAWSRSLEGPYATIWEYTPATPAADGRVLHWPEVDRSVPVRNGNSFYIRYRIRGLAIDQFRISYEAKGPSSTGVDIVHQWTENGASREKRVRIPAGVRSYAYDVETASPAHIENQAIILEAQRRAQ
ncbi:MAG: hypothetical protein JSU00_04880 [Acidobacteria bacterium]|nr:hypothetical protein [Acidobacteriota bacterium]